MLIYYRIQLTCKIIRNTIRIMCVETSGISNNNIGEKMIENKLTDLIIKNLDIKYILNNLDISENTQRDYEYRIKSFISFINDYVFNKESYLMYKKFLRDRIDIKTNSKNKYLISAKVLLKELHREGIIPYDITSSIKQFKQNKGHRVEGINIDEIKEIWKYIISQKETIQTLRWKLFFCMLAFQGLRQSEVLTIEYEDIDFTNKLLFVKSKGKDYKEKVFLYEKTIEALNSYVEKTKIKSGYIFVSHANRKSNERLSIMTINRDFQGIFRKLNIKKTIHGFRHFYITFLLQKLDIRTVRKFSRHKNLEMLIVYDDEIEIKNRTEEVFHFFSSAIP